jgi:hypothetical protein
MSRVEEALADGSSGSDQVPGLGPGVGRQQVAVLELAVSDHLFELR